MKKEKEFHCYQDYYDQQTERVAEDGLLVEKELAQAVRLLFDYYVAEGFRVRDIAGALHRLVSDEELNLLLSYREQEKVC